MEHVERPGIIALASTSVDISGRTATLEMTYTLLAVSVVFAGLGGYVGSETGWLVEFFTTFVGIIVALVLLNAIPMFAIACLKSPGLGLIALAADGFVSGLVVSPAIYAARVVDPRILVVAMALTGAIFAAVSAYVASSGRVFSPPRAIAVGVFGSLVAALLLNRYLEIGALGVMLSAGLGAFGVFILVINTSRVLRNPEGTGAIPGALMLFAGIFNVFVGVLNLLLRLTSRD